MKAIVSVVGKDHVGILALVCTILAQNRVNILDVTQSVLQEFFTMSMLVDVSECPVSFADLAKVLAEAGAKDGLDIRIAREEIFDGMYSV